MATLRRPGCPLVLRGFFPLLALRLAGLAALCGLLPVAARVLEHWWPLVPVLPIAVTGGLLVRRFAVKKILLCEDTAFLCPGALTAEASIFRRRRADVRIRRPLLVGELLDFGDVTFVTYQSRVVVREVAELRLLEDWLAQP